MKSKKVFATLFIALIFLQSCAFKERQTERNLLSIEDNKGFCYKFDDGDGSQLSIDVKYRLNYKIFRPHLPTFKRYAIFKLPKRIEVMSNNYITFSKISPLEASFYGSDNDDNFARWTGIYEVVDECDGKCSGLLTLHLLSSTSDRMYPHIAFDSTRNNAYILGDSGFYILGDRYKEVDCDKEISALEMELKKNKVARQKN